VYGTQASQQPSNDFDNTARVAAKNKYLANYYGTNVQIHGICNCLCKTHAHPKRAQGKIDNCPQVHLISHLPMQFLWFYCAQPRQLHINQACNWAQAVCEIMTIFQCSQFYLFYR